MPVAEQDDNSQYVPQPSAFGRLFRERGTRRIVIAAIVLFVVWMAYTAVHGSLMNKVTWPKLSVEPAGLTVVGLQDRDRPGWHRKYEAIESGHQWRIRRPDDADDEVAPAAGNKAQNGFGKKKANGEEDEEAKERGNDPGAGHHVARGEVVDVSEVLKTCPVVLTGKQFRGASMDKQIDSFGDREYYTVHLNLTEEGRSRYYQFSHRHEGERLVFVLNGEIVTCAVMTSMDVSTLDIDPVWMKEDAAKLVDFINQHAAK